MSIEGGKLCVHTAVQSAPPTMDPAALLHRPVIYANVATLPNVRRAPMALIGEPASADSAPTECCVSDPDRPVFIV